MAAGRNRDVFVNCPFTGDYGPRFRALLFTIIRSGFNPRCALEIDDSSDVRIDKICRIIAACRFGIHDISYVRLDPKSRLPRFNMPFELGLFIGAKRFGDASHATKMALVIDARPYRYMKFLSDISGQDIRAYGASTKRLIAETATWLRDKSHDPAVPGGAAISAEFRSFARQLPRLCRSVRLERDEMTYHDLTSMMSEWIAVNRRADPSG